MKLDRKSKQLVLVGVILYFVSYLTRVNYAAVISEVIRAESIPTTAASLVLMATAVTYGVGQLISGFLGDRIRPERLILFGLITTVCMNILLPVCAPHTGLMAAAWAVNGLAQACMWPPLIKILTTVLTGEQYLRVIPIFGISSGGGTAVMYLIAPFFIRNFGNFGWRMVFVFSAACGVAMTVTWVIFSARRLSSVDFFANRRVRVTAPERGIRSLGISLPLLGLMLVTIMFQGFVREGIQNWVPSLLADKFSLGTDQAILTTFVLPAFYTCFVFVLFRILRLMRNKVFVCTASMFAGIALMLGAFLLLGNGNALWLAVILLVLSSSFSRAVNTMQTTCFQKCLPDTGNIAFLTGLLNSVVYIGSTLSSPICASVADSFGWNATVAVWAGISAAGCLLTVVLALIARRRGMYYRG